MGCGTQQIAHQSVDTMYADHDMVGSEVQAFGPGQTRRGGGGAGDGDMLGERRVNDAA